MKTQRKLSMKERDRCSQMIQESHNCGERERFYQMYHSLLRLTIELDSFHKLAEMEAAGDPRRIGIAPWGPGWKEGVRENVFHLTKIYREFPKYVRKIYDVDIEEIEKKATSLVNDFLEPSKTTRLT